MSLCRQKDATKETFDSDARQRYVVLLITQIDHGIIRLGPDGSSRYRVRSGGPKPQVNMPDRDHLVNSE